jgi:type I restriction enzyme M protein
VAPDLAQLERSLWDAADELRANSGLKASGYGTPVLRLIFLRFADATFAAARDRIEAKASARRRVGPKDYHAAGVIQLDEAARFRYLLDRPEGADLGRAVNEAMRLVEKHNPDLSGVLPRAYTSLPSTTIAPCCATSTATQRISRAMRLVSSTSTSSVSSPPPRARRAASSSRRRRSSA